MFKCEREKEILDILKQTEYATVEYLSKKMCISPSSIRRDLSSMEAQGLVLRSYGGVQITDSVNSIVSFSMRSHKNIREKKRIALTAATLVKEGDVIFADGSSSSYFLLSELVSIKDITIITNSIDGLYFLTQFGVKAISTGGMISTENHSVLINHFADSVISSIQADIAFFSAQGIATDGTIYDCYLSEIPLRKLMMEHAKTTAFLCDSNKLGKTAAWKQCHINDVDYIVSDTDLSFKFEGNIPTSKFLSPQANSNSK